MSDHDDHFVMVWGDFWKSSILKEDVVTRFVFLACLDECDPQGRFRATPFYLAQKTVIPMDQVEVALECLQRPDPDSTHQEHGGARIVSTGPNEWLAPAYPDYRKRWGKIKRRLADKYRKRDERGQVRTDADECGQVRTESDPVSVSVSVPVSVPDKGKDKDKGGSKGGKKKVEKKPDYTHGFETFWGASWRRGSKAGSFSTWQAMEAEEQIDARAVVGAWTKAFEQRDAQKRPHVVTWLNNRGWEDEVNAEYGRGKVQADPEIKDKYAKFDDLGGE